MTRRDYYDDPQAPRAQRIVPAVTVVVLNGAGEVLLERRSDNGRWGLPGGVQEIGETIAETAVREVREETGIDVAITGLVGVYSDPGHVIAFDDGEVRQEFSLCFRAEAVGGAIAVSDESFGVRWFAVVELDELDMTVSTRRRLRDGLSGGRGPVIA